MQKIKTAEKREHITILVSSSILLIGGILLLLFFFNQNLIILLLGLVVTVWSVDALYKQYLVISSGELPLIKILLKEPHKVVWVYSIVTQRMPFGFQTNQTGTMYFKLMDGNEITLSVPASEIKAISELLNYHLPHATFGYTKEREQWFLAHPALLVKDKDAEK